MFDAYNTLRPNAPNPFIIFDLKDSVFCCYCLSFAVYPRIFVVSSCFDKLMFMIVKANVSDKQLAGRLSMMYNPNRSLCVQHTALSSVKNKA